MNNSTLITDETSDYIAIGSGVYLILVFIAGATCNINALIKAYQVGIIKYAKNVRTNIFKKVKRIFIKATI